MPLYLNQKPQKISPFLGKLFVWLLCVVSNFVSAQIHVSENATLSISKNAYIYTKKEIAGNHNALAIYKDKGILFVAKSSSKEKPAQKKQNVLDHSNKHIAKNEKSKKEIPVYKITNQPLSEKSYSIGAESTLAVVTHHKRELGITAHIFFIENNIYIIENPVFGRNINSENKHFHTTPKIRPPPLSFRV